MKIKEIIILILFLSVQSCKPGEYFQIFGETMGTYYRIKCDLSSLTEIQPRIDSILLEINNNVSTYIDSSFISVFNRSEEGVIFRKDSGMPEHFYANFIMSKEVYKATGGKFDPTVMPLVNFWGFGFDERQGFNRIDTVKIDSLRSYIGFDQIYIRPVNDSMEMLFKEKTGCQLDFSAIAKGYAIDVLAQYFEQLHSRNYLIEIGGELRASGKNDQGNDWVVGINTPRSEAFLTDIYSYISVSNKAMATSGNYRNFYELDGQMISHTINPNSGFPERSNLLSSTVLANKCSIADAFATGFMVIGMEQGLILAEEHDEIEAAFIYSDEAGQMKMKFTSGFKKYLLDDSE